MILVEPSMIPKIDKYASDALGIPLVELMHRAGEAVANAVRTSVAPGSRVSILAGKGNNGGDGYAAACLLMQDYRVRVYDVFGCGQRSEEGKYFLDQFTSCGGDVLSLDDLDSIRGSDCIIDAIFGTGFAGEYPEWTARLADILSSLDGCVKIAIDVPLGVSAGDGSVEKTVAYCADVTVTLGFVKPGLVSYPAKKYIGKLVYDNIGLHNSDILTEFKMSDYYIDGELASSFVPIRDQDSNKGSFGKLLLISGSPEFPGAAHLSLEAALRGGVGLVTYVGDQTLTDSLVAKLPEAIYKPCAVQNLTDDDIECVLGLSSRHSATLIGSGSSRSLGISRLVSALLSVGSSPIILDADAINALAENPEHGRELIRKSLRPVVLTPHPLELSRISGIPTDVIQQNRLSVARKFAAENNCILVLKGAATVVTDGKTTYVNSSGSSALAKAGSGDVLAGLLASVIASGVDPIKAAAMSVYFHGLAADVLSDELSELGVTPSDLPKEIARQIASSTRVK